jgi:hypothetical protein
VKLDVALADYVDYKKSNIVKVRPETKEVKLMFPAHSYRYLGASGLSQADVVALDYRYAPYQGIGALSGLKTLTDSGKGFITTYGTGKAKSTGFSNATYPFPIVSLLPQTSAYKDSDFVNDGLVSGAGVSAANVNDLMTFNLISDDANHTSAAGYRKLRIGDTFNIAASSNGGRGSGYVSSSITHQVTLKFVGSGTDAGKKVMYGLYWLAIANGELYLVVATAVNSTTIALDGSTGRAIDIFKLPGRPLVKGA